MIQVLWTVAIAILLWLGGIAPTWAADLEHGKQVFASNCAVCHLKGRNAVIANKTLHKGVLQQYGLFSPEAITNQVTYGKNAMPAFKGRLDNQDIQDVAAYVLAQANQNWGNKLK
jgi:cytochrome c6